MIVLPPVDPMMDMAKLTFAALMFVMFVMFVGPLVA